MTEQIVDLFKIAEISRVPQTNQVVINLKEVSLWEVYLCDCKGEIDSSFPQLYLTESKNTYCLCLKTSDTISYLYLLV